MKRRQFVRNTAYLSGLAMLPSCAVKKLRSGGRLRTAHIGVGGMGAEDLKSLASHPSVDITALCDVDSNILAAAQALYSKAKVYKDYRIMLKELSDNIDAVIVSTPDHTHAPASMMAMEMDKAVYCQKPLTHHVSEARAMSDLAAKKGLVTQMGIQVHSFYDYKLATKLIQTSIIGKVHTVRAWSPKNWGYDGPKPAQNDPIPNHLDWNLWLGTAPVRPYKEGMYHTQNWRKIMDYGCGTFGDMGVHIFDTPYNALQLGVPITITNNCRKPNGYGFPEKNVVTYEFPGTMHTADTLKWVWYDGPGAPASIPELVLPDQEVLPEQGAIFYGEKGTLLLPHFMQLPRLIVDGKFVEIDLSKYNTKDVGVPTVEYALEADKHYHQFVDACLGRGECSAPFSYSAKLTETILLGVIAGSFPNKTLHWDSGRGQFAEAAANKYLLGDYREF